MRGDVVKKGMNWVGSEEGWDEAQGGVQNVGRSARRIGSGRARGSGSVLFLAMTSLVCQGSCLGCGVKMRIFHFCLEISEANRSPP